MFLWPFQKVKKKKRKGEGSVPWTGVRVQRFLEAHQDEGDCQKDSLSCVQELENVINEQQAHVDQDTGHLHDLS
jgi:hypothetical protein